MLDGAVLEDLLDNLLEVVCAELILKRSVGGLVENSARSLAIREAC